MNQKRTIIALVVVGFLMLITITSYLLIFRQPSDEEPVTPPTDSFLPVADDAVPSIPACNGISVSKTSVESPNEPIEITMTGSVNGVGTPTKISLYAAAGGQVNKSPGDSVCEGSDKSSDQYSFYCNGTKVWALVSEGTSVQTHSLTTTFEELMDLVTSNAAESGIPFEGDLNQKGIQLSVNVVGPVNTDICSSNIAYKNGDGVYFNGGNWDIPCTGGCHPLITLAGSNPAQALKCDNISINKGTVSSLDEEVIVTVNASNGSKTPGNISLFTSPAAQINKNPSNFICVNDDKNDPEYSYYCGGPDSWFLAESVTNDGNLTFATTYQQLKQLIDNGVNDGGNPYTGDLNQLGIVIGANVSGDSSVELCSSNLAYNSGQGAYFNGGAWDVACQNSCSLVLKYEQVVEPSACNESCATTAECGNGLVCSQGKCRNSACTAEASCTCTAPPTTTPPPTTVYASCQQSCSATTPCGGGLSCVGGRCVNAACSAQANCVCQGVPVTNLPNTADGDETILFVLIALSLFMMAGLVVTPILLPEGVRVKRPSRFRRDF